MTREGKENTHFKFPIFTTSLVDIQCHVSFSRLRFPLVLLRIRMVLYFGAHLISVYSLQELSRSFNSDIILLFIYLHLPCQEMFPVSCCYKQCCDTHTEFHQVQVNRRDKFSWVGGIAEADLSTLVISVNISNHLCLHITESTRFSHQNKFFFSFSQSFGFYTKPLQDTYMLTLESGTYSERQPSDCAQGLARISSAPAQCSWIDSDTLQ